MTGPQNRTLRRARTERMLFGVCGGIAKYFGIDPTLVRVGFVLVGVIPPLGGTLLLAYVALAIVVPPEDLPADTGREQVRENLSSLRTELSGLAETIRAKVTGEPSAPPAEEKDSTGAVRTVGTVVAPEEAVVAPPRDEQTLQREGTSAEKGAPVSGRV